MEPVRVYGDPFVATVEGLALRAFVRALPGCGLAAGLSLGALRPAPPGAAVRTVRLTDGARAFAVATDLPAAELEALAALCRTPVPATAPVVVFAPPGEREDALAVAGLEWPRAAAVLDGSGATAELVGCVREVLRRAGTEDPPVGCDAAALRAWLGLPPPVPGGPVLHVGSDDPAAGSDVAVRVFAARFLAAGRRLRVVLPARAAAFALRLRALALAVAPRGADVDRGLEFATGPLRPLHASDCDAVLQPMRALRHPELLVRLLASGRPVAATRWAATAALLGGPGVAAPIGGSRPQGTRDVCEPDPNSAAAALRSLLADPAAARLAGRRARAHVVQELQADRPAAPQDPPAAPRDPPRIVLEAPFFETSSAAELSIETALALHRRGNCELLLVPALPLRHGLPWFRRRAPELEPLLHRPPAGADLWLAGGWPPRAARPPCRTFALRVDWEYGALPAELCPLVTEEADLVVVHSRHVMQTIVAAGRPADRLLLVPHGVDAEVFRPDAPPLSEVAAFRGAGPVLLFVGGLVFRKGFDLFLRAALEVSAAGTPLSLVVKDVGSDQHYAGFHLGALLERVRTTRGAPPVLHLLRDLTRAEMAGLYRACDLLCHPYRGEGFGMPVLEAMACGLPVAVTAGGATADFAQGPGVVELPALRRAVDLPGAHRGQPWLLEPRADAAAALLASALGRRAELRAAAVAAAPGVAARHTWDAAAAALERACAAAAGAAREGQPAQTAPRAPEPSPRR